MKKILLTLGTFLLFLSSVIFAPAAFAAESFSSPNIIDNAEMFTVEETQRIDKSLTKTWVENNLLTVVETIDTLDGENLETYATDRANELGIGLPNESNGVYFLIVKNDRLVRIELGKGTNNFITDNDAKRIIDMTVTPVFSTGNYADGVIRGVEDLGEMYTKAMNGENTNVSTSSNGSSTGIMFTIFFILLGGFIIGIIFYTRHLNSEDKSSKYLVERLNFERKIVRLFLQTNHNSLTPEERVKKIQSLIEENPPVNQKVLHDGFVQEVLNNYMKSISRSYLKNVGFSDTEAMLLVREGSFNVKELLKDSSVIEKDKVLKQEAKKLKDKKESLKREAKTLYKKLSRNQKREIQNASSSRRKKLLEEYTGTSSNDVSILLPYMTALYFTNSSSSSSGSSSYSGSSSSSSSSSYSGYDSSSYSSFGGGSFDGGGASGSW